MSKLAQEVSALENVVNSYLAASAPPLQVSEAVIDHDYTVLALKRFGEGAKDFWQSTLRGMKKIEISVADPVKHFLQNDLRMLKVRRCRCTMHGSVDSLLLRTRGKR